MLPKKEQMYKSRRLFSVHQTTTNIYIIPLYYTILQKYIVEKVAQFFIAMMMDAFIFLFECTLQIVGAQGY